MTEVTVLIEPSQEKRILRALRRGKGCKIKVRKIDTDQESPMSLSRDVHAKHPSKGILLLNPSQMKRYQKASPGPISIPFRHTDLQQNMKCKGGFLPILAAALAPVIGGIAGGLIEREIAGSGVKHPKIVWCKKSGAYEVKPMSDGQGLHLRPWQHTRPSGFGLYLSHYPYNVGTGVTSRDELKNFTSKQKQSLVNLM